MIDQQTAASLKSTTTLQKVQQMFETEGAISSREELDQLLEQAELPANPRMRTGKLANGLAYTILPNAVPAGRFEAHLQIMAGSADETQEQQGMAHMCEHVSYMGSRKRERLFGTSSQTNAQTDFHHTVYWAACPTRRPSTGAPMLPLALDALLDVLEARFETTRVEKERAAILSEAAMVNTIDYRVEVQLLAALHAENRLHRRFPIGQIEQIKAWTPQQVQAYHDAHYRPNNAHLYVIGDLDPDEADDMIGKMFSHLPARDPPKYLPEEGVDDVTLKQTNPFFPPINHEWMGGRIHGKDDHKVLILRNLHCHCRKRGDDPCMRSLLISICVIACAGAHLPARAHAVCVGARLCQIPGGAHPLACRLPPRAYQAPRGGSHAGAAQRACAR